MDEFTNEGVSAQLFQLPENITREGNVLKWNGVGTPPNELPARILPDGVIACPVCNKTLDGGAGYGSHRRIHQPLEDGTVPTQSNRPYAQHKKQVVPRAPKSQRTETPSQQADSLANFCPRCGLNIASFQATMEILREKGAL